LSPRTASRAPAIVTSVREFVERDVMAAAPALEHADRYPHELVDRMKRMGLFGALVPTDYGGLGLDVTTYAQVIEELCRGFMSLAGVINSHTMAALIVLNHGTDEQRLRLLPRFASGQARGGLCLTEPHAGSDVQAIRTRAVREGDEYVITGQKMWATNGLRAGITDAEANERPRRKPGLAIRACCLPSQCECSFELVAPGPYPLAQRQLTHAPGPALSSSS